MHNNYNPYRSSNQKAVSLDHRNQGIFEMLSNEMSDKFKNEDEEMYVSPYAHLEKAAVLQEARIFHDPVAVRENPRKCCTVIAQLLHLQNTGQNLSSNEATEVFFGVTKLFMSDDASLRRMVYLFIKEVSENCNADDVIIVTSSLTKDMTCDVDLYRANALRVLTRIVDPSMLGAIERYVKQAVVDSSGQVSSSALVSATHLFLRNPECAAIVRRWISETTEATSSPNHMVQFHALQLLYQIKSHDRLGVSKLVAQYGGRGSLRSPLAVVLLVRFTSKLMIEEIEEGRSTGGVQGGSNVVRTGYQFLEASLRHKSELVGYEAARAICALPGAEPQDLTPAVSVLQMYLSSPKCAVRFASMRTLAEVSNTNPRVVSKCNEDLEALIGDANRSIATLAITTLLKTGSENSVDRLLKQISAFLTDIADEYKIAVVGSLQKLCLTYPSKHRVLVGFLSNFLREEGGFEFKRSIVESIVSLIRTVPETTESSLLHFCEFIEDCEFTMLSTRILHLLGDLGPTTPSPGRYVRFVYNRVILENSCVRAAAVSALTKFACKVPSLRSSILSLLHRSLHDEDDETRDRVAVAVKVLERALEESPPVVRSDENGEEGEAPEDAPAPDDSAHFLLAEDMPVSFDGLERSLKAYAATPGAMNDGERLTFRVLPVVEDDVPSASGTMDDAGAPVAAVDPADPAAPERPAAERADPAAAVRAVPELAALGRVFRSTAPAELTESETEYVVSCVKHVLEDHVILQFTVRNTIEDQRLDNVSVSVDASDADLYEVEGEIPAASVSYGDAEHCFALLRRDASLPLSAARLPCELRFTVVAVDPVTGEEEGGEPFEEDYPLEDLDVPASDFVARTSVPDFRRAWETIGNAVEVLERFALRSRTVEEGVGSVVELLGMRPCDGTAVLKPNAAGKPHMLHLSGSFVGGATVLARGQVGTDKASGGVVLKIAVRSEDPVVCRVIIDCIR